MRIVDGGKLNLTITPEVRERLALADRREIYFRDLGQLADAICTAFCGPQGLTRGMSAVQMDIHRRQHLEIARSINEAKE